MLSLLLTTLVETASNTVTEKHDCSEAKLQEKTLDLLTLHVLMLVPSKLGPSLFFNCKC